MVGEEKVEEGRKRLFSKYFLDYFIFYGKKSLLIGLLPGGRYLTSWSFFEGFFFLIYLFSLRSSYWEERASFGSKDYKNNSISSLRFESII